MSTSGMARKVDDLGRIVLPVEMRRLFGIQAGDALDIAVEDRGIVLRKVETRCVFCGATEQLRSHRGKQLCSSCVAELAAPAAGDTTGAVAAAGDTTGDVAAAGDTSEGVAAAGGPAASEGVAAAGGPAASEVVEPAGSRAEAFAGLPTPAEFAEQLPPPPQPSPAALELDEAVATGTVETLLTQGDAQGDVVDTPSWDS